MANLPSSINPLGYVINRQLIGSEVIKSKLFRERFAQAKNLYQNDLSAHYGCVNAIEFSDEGELLVSGGDDRRVLLWSLPEAIHGLKKPTSMQTDHASNIFCLGFDSKNIRLFSGGNDDQVIVHDINTGGMISKITHKAPVYGLSVNPNNDNVIATAGDDGRILLIDVREPVNIDNLCIANHKTGFHSVMFNPTNAVLLATANSKEGIGLWDVRKPGRFLIRYDYQVSDVSGISVCFNSNGSKLLALRRRLPPVLYNTNNESALCQFYHPQYFNSCTMKTCCFAGDDDQYVLSGSDDFNLYMWRVPHEDSEWGDIHLILRGHRSIVNQVRYNKRNNLIASSGVEKMVKLWGTLPTGNWKGSLLKQSIEPPRRVYSHDDYAYLVGHTGQRISHDYSDQSIQEDCRMMAFFDTLIQREIEGWQTGSDTDSSEELDTDSLRQLISTSKRHSKVRKTPPERYNRISELIAHKRKRLEKMARSMSSSSIRSRTQLMPPPISTVHLGKKKRSSSKIIKNGSTAQSKSNHRKHTSKSKAEIRSAVHRHSRIPSNFKKAEKIYYNVDNLEETPSIGLDSIPSTSSGITRSNKSHYRLVEPDSEEEAISHITVEDESDSEEEEESRENLVNILPTPLNGTHDLSLNTLLSNTNGNVVALRSEDDFTNDDGVFQRILRRSDVALNNRISFEFNDDSDSDSDCENGYTPVNNRKRRYQESSANFSMEPCSSNDGDNSLRDNNHLPCSSKSVNGFHSGHSSDEEGCRFEKFRQQQSKRSRLHVRKRIGHDSDSN